MIHHITRLLLLVENVSVGDFERAEISLIDFVNTVCIKITNKFTLLTLRKRNCGGSAFVVDHPPIDTTTAVTKKGAVCVRDIERQKRIVFFVNLNSNI